MNGQNPNNNQNNVVNTPVNGNTNIGNTNVNPQQSNIENSNQINVSQSINQNTVNSVPSSSNNIQNSQAQSTTMQMPQVNQENVEQQTTTNISENDSKNKNPNYKPPGAFKTFLLIVFFGGLVAFIIFLPEIQAFVAQQRSGKVASNEITTGKLICKLKTNTANLDKSFERIFNYTDKKLVSSTFTTVIKGDITEDATTLDELNQKCRLIKTSVADINGISITCDYASGILTEKEVFDYKEYDMEKVKTAYTEAGGDVLEYEYGHDIDKIQATMIQGGFTCNKER